MNAPTQRPDAATFWLAQATHFLHRYMASPEPARMQSLLETLRQYENHVREGRVEPMRFLTRGDS